MTKKANIDLILFRLDEMNAKLDKYITKTECNSDEIIGIKRDIKTFNSFQTFLSVIGSALATGIAWLITRNK